jgi:anti-sigma regulatory factor (Ser/Thr protein kinase)
MTDLFEGEGPSLSRTSLYDDLVSIGFMPTDIPIHPARALRFESASAPLAVELPSSLEDGTDAICPEADIVIDPHCHYLCSDLQSLLERAQGGLCLCLSTKRAYRGNTASMFLARLKQRLPSLVQIEESLHLAVHEAVTNAIIHGNLEIESKDRANLVYFREYITRLVEKVEHPVFSRKAVILTAVWSAKSLTIAVEDCGPGFDPWDIMSRPIPPAATSGRGLGLIRKMSHSIDFALEGRRTEMTFLLPE